MSSRYARGTALASKSTSRRSQSSITMDSPWWHRLLLRAQELLLTVGASCDWPIFLRGPGAAEFSYQETTKWNARDNDLFSRVSSNATIVPCRLFVERSHGTPGGSAPDAFRERMRGAQSCLR